MRSAWIVAAAVAATLAMPPVAAQEPCSEAEPCAIPLDIDDGTITFGGAAAYSTTAGDWMEFDTFNGYDMGHDITIADLGIDFTAPGLDDGGPGSLHGPYLFDAPGDYTITDLTTGATATLHVLWEDVRPTTTGKESPGVAVPVGLLALAALAFLQRR